MDYQLRNRLLNSGGEIPFDMPIIERIHCDVDVWEDDNWCEREERTTLHWAAKTWLRECAEGAVSAQEDADAGDTVEAKLVGTVEDQDGHLQTLTATITLVVQSDRATLLPGDDEWACSSSIQEHYAAEHTRCEHGAPGGRVVRCGFGCPSPSMPLCAQCLDDGKRVAWPCAVAKRQRVASW